MCDPSTDADASEQTNNLSAIIRDATEESNDVDQTDHINFLNSPTHSSASMRRPRDTEQEQSVAKRPSSHAPQRNLFVLESNPITQEDIKRFKAQAGRWSDGDFTVNDVIIGPAADVVELSLVSDTSLRAIKGADLRNWKTTFSVTEVSDLISKYFGHKVDNGHTLSENFNKVLFQYSYESNAAETVMYIDYLAVTRAHEATSPITEALHAHLISLFEKQIPPHSRIRTDYFDAKAKSISDKCPDTEWKHALQRFALCVGVVRERHSDLRQYGTATGIHYNSMVKRQPSPLTVQPDHRQGRELDSRQLVAPSLLLPNDHGQRTERETQPHRPRPLSPFPSDYEQPFRDDASSWQPSRDTEHWQEPIPKVSYAYETLPPLQQRPMAPLPKREAAQPPRQLADRRVCQSCGHEGHSRQACRFLGFPDSNTDTTLDWSASPMGLLWKRHGHDVYQAELSLPGISDPMPLNPAKQLTANNTNANRNVGSNSGGNNNNTNNNPPGGNNNNNNNNRGSYPPRPKGNNNSGQQSKHDNTLVASSHGKSHCQLEYLPVFLSLPQPGRRLPIGDTTSPRAKTTTTTTTTTTPRG